MTQQQLYHAIRRDFSLNGPDAGVPLLRYLDSDEDRDRMYDAVYASWTASFHGNRRDRLGLGCCETPKRPIPKWYRESGTKRAIDAYHANRAYEAIHRVSPEKLKAGGWACGFEWSESAGRFVTIYAPAA